MKSWLAVFVLAIGCWAMADAGTPVSGQWDPLPEGPGARWGHVMIYDPLRDRLIVHGGWNNAQFLGDLWEFPLGTDGPWRAIAALGTPPSARAFHSAIYDPDRDRMILYGGFNAGPALGDVWGLELGGATPGWQPIAPTGTPPGARYWHSAVYDARYGRMTIFGGQSGSTFFDDTWELDLRSPTEAWTAPVPDLGTPPPARCCHEAAFVPGFVDGYLGLPTPDSRLFVFGGWNGSAELGDLWQLRLDTVPGDGWTALATNGAIPARTDHVGALDWVRNRYLVHGGVTGMTRLGDVWSVPMRPPYDWQPLAPSGKAPAARSDHAAVYDPVRDRVVVFGGKTGAEALGDAWALSFGANPAVHLTCSSDTTYIPGDSVLVRFDFTNPFATGAEYRFDVSSTRSWPSTTGGGSIFVYESVSRHGWRIHVPDTASAGANDFTFRVWARGAPLLADSCTVRLSRMSTPVLVSLVDAHAVAGEVRLEWRVSTGREALSLRRTRDGQVWNTIARLVPDGIGRAAYADTDVRPGGRYGYRVSARDSDAPLVEDVWVEVPLTDLALHRAWHRSGKLWLDVTLPESGGARVELVDLAGRRVVTEPIPSGEAGRRQVAVTCTARSGVYFARVLHGTRSAHAKVVIAR